MPTNASKLTNVSIYLCVNMSYDSSTKFLLSLCANSSFSMNSSETTTKGMDDILALKSPGSQPIWMNTANYVFAGIYLFLILPVLFSNALVLVAIWKYRVLHKVSNMFIASMSCADFLIGLFTLPIYAATFIMQNEVTKYQCLVKYSCVVFSMSASLISLVCIAIDRYIAIVYPFAYANIMTWRNAKRILTGVWIYHILIFILPVSGWNNWKEGAECDFFKIMPLPYSIITTIIAITICLVMGLYLYIRIFIKARRQRILIAKAKSLMSDAGVEQFHRDTKAAKVMAIALLIFSIFWFPFLIAGILKYLPTSQHVIETLKNGALWLAMSNSFVNPIVYCWMRQDFHRVFQQMALGVKTNILQNFKTPELDSTITMGTSQGSVSHITLQ